MLPKWKWHQNKIGMLNCTFCTAGILEDFWYIVYGSELLLSWKKIILLQIMFTFTIDLDLMLLD